MATNAVEAVWARVNTPDTSVIHGRYRRVPGQPGMQLGKVQGELRHLQQGAAEHFTDDFLDQQHRLRVVQQRGDVLAQHTEVPDLLVQVEADEPAEQQVVVELFVELLLAGYRIQQLQQENVHDGLGSDLHAGVGIQRAQELTIVVEQVIDLRTQQHQEMAGRDIAGDFLQDALT